MKPFCLHAGRQLPKPAKPIRPAHLLRRPAFGLEEPRARDDDDDRLRAAGGDVEAVRVVEERHAARRIFGRGTGAGVDDDGCLLPLEAVHRADAINAEQRLDDSRHGLVLDFVGRYREEFRFDQLLQVMTGLPKRRLIEDLEHGFPTLPPACHIAFDRVAGERVLASLKYIARQTWPRLARELQGYAAIKGPGNVSLATFLNDQALELSDIYRANAAGGWTALRRSAGLLPTESSDEEAYLGRRFSDLLHSNDALALKLWAEFAERGSQSWGELGAMERRRIQMLAYQLFPRITDRMSGKEFLERLEAHRYLREELGELSNLLAARAELPVRCLPGLPEEWPLLLYGRYEIREILTAVGWLSESRRTPHQSGKVALDDKKVELLFVTLDKAEGY